MPYNLDQAVRRRFDKRVYIPLPEAPARATMLKIHLKDTPHNLTDKDFKELGEKLHGFSGSDCAVLVSPACLIQFSHCLHVLSFLVMLFPVCPVTRTPGPLRHVGLAAYPGEGRSL